MSEFSNIVEETWGHKSWKNAHKYNHVSECNIVSKFEGNMWRNIILDYWVFLMQYCCISTITKAVFLLCIVRTYV